jgi:hypothetical protein
MLEINVRGHTRQRRCQVIQIPRPAEDVVPTVQHRDAQQPAELLRHTHQTSKISAICH